MLFLKGSKGHLLLLAQLEITQEHEKKVLLHKQFLEFFVLEVCRHSIIQTLLTFFLIVFEVLLAFFKYLQIFISLKTCQQVIHKLLLKFDIDQKFANFIFQYCSCWGLLRLWFCLNLWLRLRLLQLRLLIYLRSLLLKRGFFSFTLIQSFLRQFFLFIIGQFGKGNSLAD